MSISVEVTGLDGLSHISDYINAAHSPSSQRHLLNLVGAEVESQTRRRISEEKTAPDGSPWAAWSEQYAKHRSGNNSLLDSSGQMLNSITYQVQGDSVHIGSNLLYVAMHQKGFDARVNISAHTRLITQAFGRALNHPVYQSVKAHVRNMFIPQRELLGLSSENERALLDIIVRHHEGITR